LPIAEVRLCFDISTRVRGASTAAGHASTLTACVNPSLHASAVEGGDDKQGTQQLGIYGQLHLRLEQSVCKPDNRL
jgi:hypothetical protein